MRERMAREGISSKESFLIGIAQVHYIDVEGANTVCGFIHGTPNQWCDEQCGWILKEKEELDEDEKIGYDGIASNPKATASLAMASSDLRRPPKRLRTPMLSEVRESTAFPRYTCIH
ncbi:hypothetical protein F2Q70_00038421 [Brassica cretica]|uniref:Uncharacterized protein n=1 Tax=Brassica cretica TaxID=69181 RepID=A0A8S9K5V3_BRACR|nr:hypothetical protein F2Q70_00038421 [Brassica cretica]